MYRELVSALVGSCAILRCLSSGDLELSRELGVGCTVMMLPLTLTYCFYKHRAARGAVSLPRVKQTHRLGLVSVWEAVTQLTEVPAELSCHCQVLYVTVKLLNPAGNVVLRPVRGDVMVVPPLGHKDMLCLRRRFTEV